MNSRHAILLLATVSFCFLHAAPVPDPAAEPRMAVCLNGTWDTVLNADGGQIPSSGWSPRRVPALPIAARPPADSVWYRYSVRIPKGWSKPERSFLLKIDKSGHYTAVYWNGKLMGENYGQFSPFETDVTKALKPGEANEIAIFVHNASGKYARPGADITDPMEGNAYRGATDNQAQRNWIGMVGDISLEWRPAAHIADVFVIPSVRKKQLTARVETVGGDPEGSTLLRATVLDGDKAVLDMPGMSVSGRGPAAMAAAWSDPVLWGPEPYGKPKLYVLRTELLRKGKVIDRQFTRFGFREVWIDGKDVMLNGKKLWMSGTYFPKLAPIRYLNDRRPQTRMLQVMQESGLNTLHGHWDDIGEPWLDLCDEMGVVVLGGMYCDGRPQIQSKAGAGWDEFMLGACRRWTRTVRHHPSIVAWRQTDSVMPPGANSGQMTARYMEVVRAEDGTRPFATDNEHSEIAAHAQSPLKNPREPNGEYEDGSVIAQKLSASTRPVLTKEIYAGFRDNVDKLTAFFRQFYQKSWDGRGTGVIVQHIPLIERSTPFRIQWLSDSGPGNRDVDNVPQATLPNWCDPAQPMWAPSPYARLFAELGQQYMKHAPVAERRVSESEVLVSGLKPNELAILLAKDPAVAESLGIRAAGDGTAWIVAPRAGEYSLIHEGGSLAVHAPAQTLPAKPGYDYVDRVSVTKH